MAVEMGLIQLPPTVDWLWNKELYYLIIGDYEWETHTHQPTTVQLIR